MNVQTETMEAGVAADLCGPDMDVFKSAMSDMPAAVTVVTCRDWQGRPVGTTLSAVSSLSLAPPMMLACFDVGSNTLKALLPGVDFLIHVLAEGQEKVAYGMAGKGTDKFDDIECAAGPGGLLQIAGCAAVIHCSVGQRVPGGDHVIVTGNVRRVTRAGAVPLVYHRRALFPIPTQTQE
ncbi:MAG: flavin reductase family protein [Roseovarius sp.]|jgi:flavin reductase (DIM6/NTAB) family NADH-FMN oxidoreductase RutF|uniref:flavin reductase family protein n=1 Tax=unclassified Roseovarius TaxID=2614913 RepID=UPI00273EC470|nr:MULTISPECIES: flavin reductase family protein [unclassified Roseovarius]